MIIVRGNKYFPREGAGWPSFIFNEQMSENGHILAKLIFCVETVSFHQVVDYTGFNTLEVLQQLRKPILSQSMFDS